MCSQVNRFPSLFSDVSSDASLEVIATGDQMKSTVAFE